MNKHALLNVARALRESPAPNRFTMSMFGHSCGTPACALGHYAARRDLQHTFQLDSGALRYADGAGGVWLNSITVREHFDLTSEQIDTLFDEHGCDNAQTAEQAALFIEYFVECNGELEPRECCQGWIDEHEHSEDCGDD